MRRGAFRIALFLGVIVLTVVAQACSPAQIQGVPDHFAGTKPVGISVIGAPPGSARPFAARRPALSNQYRLRGVHYFQRGWPYTFWDTLRTSGLDSDFAELRSQGFNTIVLF